ncbi:MAG: Glutathione-regulated potassium-efflux system ancillary protein KefF [Myxococcales bacterium]|nr:Glutathione-regulated potassium-efflux system ancillary protein KefF [Myxococcales bacterium]
MPRTIDLIYAHPYPDRSRAGRTLLAGVRDLPGVEVRSLYDLYPDFAIDVDAEREALVRADIVVWQSPFYWYGMPSLLHLWIEKVLAHGWAYGAGGTAVQGKTTLWATTTGAPAAAYQPGQMHGHPFEAFVPAISQTARFCGMRWAGPPFVLHGAHRVGEDELQAAAAAYRRRLEALATEEPDA